MLIWLVAPVRGATDSGDPTVPADPPGFTIDSVEINPENVFDLSNPRYNNLLFRLANHTHVVTRKAKVRRELLLQKGEHYDTALVAESMRNLRGLKYLFKSDIRLKKGARGENIMVVTTSDKWTTSAGISPGRSGGRNRLEISLTENNFLGLGIYMAHELFFLEEERTFYQVEVKDARMWSSNLAAGFGYSDDPRLGRLLFTLGRPLYSLSSRWGWEISCARVKKRLDYYLDETLAARDRLKLDNIQEFVQYRIGGDRLKYYFMFLHGYTSINDLGRKYNDSVFLPPETVDRLVPPPGVDSVYHYLQGTIRLQQIHFAEYRRLNRFQQPEDFNLGLDARVSVGFTIPLHMKRYWYLHLNPQYSAARNDILMIIGVSGQQWRSENRTVRTIVNGYGKTYWQYRPNQTLVGAVDYLFDRLRRGGQTLYQDEDRGLRGYPLYFGGGDSRIVVNLENRFFTDMEIMSVGIGAAVFADIGNIWAKDAPFVLGRTRSAVGGGLRLGVNRATNAEVVRIDLAYALNRGRWQISAGTDQYF
ncbi:MAG: hypothetical protein PHR28_04700 [candidate division Zixibacteria bacterium]|nr:hypothetical protein [candidate division Zixibacteria bacterium]